MASCRTCGGTAEAQFLVRCDPVDTAPGACPDCAGNGFLVGVRCLTCGAEAGIYRERCPTCSEPLWQAEEAAV